MLAHMSEMLPAMSAGHLLEPMTHKSSHPMSTKLLGLYSITFWRERFQFKDYFLVCSGLLITTVFDREINCRRAASVSKVKFHRQSVISKFTFTYCRLHFRSMLVVRGLSLTVLIY